MLLHNSMKSVGTKMECWLLMIAMLLMFRPTQGGCIEEEKRALLDIKFSIITSNASKLDLHLLPTWIDYGKNECCDWERVKCNKSTGHVTHISLSNLTNEFSDPLWSLNVSLFLHFQELTSLNLSHNGIMDTGLGKFPILRKLKILDVAGNGINDSLITSLSSFPSLEVLDLSGNPISRSFPAQELAQLTNLKKLDLSFANLTSTSNIEDCKTLSRLKMMESIALSNNNFNNKIFSCLSGLQSLKFLDLMKSISLGSVFPVQEFPIWPAMEVLLLRHNHFNGTLPIQAFASFHHLEVLDLSENYFFGSIPSTIQALSSLRVVSLSRNNFNGSLPAEDGLCELKKLHELDLSYNMLQGILPQCFDSLSSLEWFDISSNQFTGTLPPTLIGNLTSLVYIDFSHNKFEGSFSFSSFSNHTKLKVVRFKSDNDKFEVETEKPIDWIPLFQLEVLALINCNMNRHNEHVVPRFLLQQHKLRVVVLSHNSLEGHVPTWLMKNNTNLEVLNLRNNSFDGIICMPLGRNVHMQGLDLSGNRMIGIIPNDIPNSIPKISRLNLSRNALSGPIPSTVSDLSELKVLDLSHNELSGKVPKELFTDLTKLIILKLSGNKLHGQVLSGNLSLGIIEAVHLDSNQFTGNIGNTSDEHLKLLTLDLSSNFFTGSIPGWISNKNLSELVLRNNSLEGQFPCGEAPFSFLDISQNYFSGLIPSCLNLKHMKHFHLGSNRFTGSIPNSFVNLSSVLTLDVGNNNLSGRIPEFLGELTTLRILLLRRNNFTGSIPKQLCQLSNVSLIDLSVNSLSGSIPSCLQNITGPSDLAYVHRIISSHPMYFYFEKQSALRRIIEIKDTSDTSKIQDEVQFTTKNLFLHYKGDILDYMAGLDLSSNKLTGEIPEELGSLTHIRAMNLSHNQLTGPIPVNFSNLAKIESLDLSSNRLTGKVPSELIKVTSLAFFNVSCNNLSGRLPEMKSQFSTFTEKSYEGNPLLCGPPLENKCTTNSEVTNQSAELHTENWYDIDMTCFNGSFSSTCVTFLLGFVVFLYTNPPWRRRWFEWIEDCIFTFYYFMCDSLRYHDLP